MIKQARCAAVVAPKHGTTWIATSINRHKRILAALRKRDAEAATAIIFENIETSKQEIAGGLREMGWLDGSGPAPGKPPEMPRGVRLTRQGATEKRGRQGRQAASSHKTHKQHGLPPDSGRMLELENLYILLPSCASCRSDVISRCLRRSLPAPGFAAASRCGFNTRLAGRNVRWTNEQRGGV